MKKAFLVLMILFFVFSFVGFTKAEAVSDEDTPPLFYLVAGSFQEKENALEKQERLYEHRYYSRLMGYPIDGVLYWRVVVSQDKERDRLEEMKALLKEDGFESFIAYDSGEEEERPVDDPEPIPVPEPKPDPSENEEIRAFIMELISWLQKMLKKY